MKKSTFEKSTMRTHRISLFIATMLAAGMFSANGARADGSGFYLTASAGGMLLKSDSIEGSSTLNPNYSVGYGVGGGLGYELPALPIRLEGEVMYRSNDLDEISDGAGTTLSATGDVAGSGSVNVLTAMANAYVFIPVPFGIEPYLGAGFGYASLNVDGLKGGAVSLIDGSADTYAYQLIAGAEFDVIPGPVDIGIEYRYLALAEERLSGAAGSFDFDYQAHSVMARLRFSF